MLIAIVRTLILYIFIITALRLMGKRQISDMQPSELVVTLVVSDIASLPMQNTSQPLLSGMIPVMVLVGLEILTSVLMMKSRTVRKLVCGNPVVVIEDGRLLQKQMKRLRMTNSDLMEQLRQQNVFSLNDVQYCIVETNGALSILEKPEKRGEAGRRSRQGAWRFFASLKMTSRAGVRRPFVHKAYRVRGSAMCSPAERNGNRYRRGDSRIARPSDPAFYLYKRLFRLLRFTGKHKKAAGRAPAESLTFS